MDRVFIAGRQMGRNTSAILELLRAVDERDKRIAELEAKAANLTEFLHAHITRIAELEAALAATAVLP